MSDEDRYGIRTDVSVLSIPGMSSAGLKRSDFADTLMRFWRERDPDDKHFAIGTERRFRLMEAPAVMLEVGDFLRWDEEGATHEARITAITDTDITVTIVPVGSIPAPK